MAWVANLEREKDWPGLADYIESLTPRQRGILLEAWLRALNKAKRYDRLLEVCEAVMAQTEGAKGLRLSPPRIYRAQALSGLERHSEAMLAYAENGVLGYQPAFVSACNEALAMQDWKSMETYSQAFLDKDPTEGSVWAMKGEAICKQMRFAEAEPVLKEAVRLAPGESMAWADLSLCLYTRKAYAEALDAADRALAKAPGLLEGLYNRATALLALKRYQDAKLAFEACLAVKLEPSLAQYIQDYLHQLDRYLTSPTPSPERNRKKK